MNWKEIGRSPTTGKMQYKLERTPAPRSVWSVTKGAWCKIFGHKFVGWNWNNVRTGGYTCSRCGTETDYFNDLGD